MINRVIGVMVALASTSALAANIQIDTSDATNGLTNIYSSTIDGGSLGILRTACTGSVPPDSDNCTFWVGGELALGAAVRINPDGSLNSQPSGVTNAVPGGIAGPPPSGSFLDITLTGGNTMATINGGVITLPDTTLVIPDSGGNHTVITTSGAGFEILVGGSAAIDSNGVVQFLIEGPGTDLAADFSTFTSVVTSCTGALQEPGPLCALIPLLGLDMDRYILTLDFNDSFTAFTGNFIGETLNNSLVYATLNSAPIPVPAAVWLFGSALGLLGWARRRAA